MARGIPRHVCGEQVALALIEAKPNGLTTQQLTVVTSLTASQIRNGIVFIREFYASKNTTPLTWTRKDGYRFSDNPEDWIAYERAQFHSELTRITRLLKGTVDPHAARDPQGEWISIVLAQLNAVRASLEMITTWEPTPA